MHVLLEGVVPHETSCILFLFVVILKDSLEELNNRIISFFETLEVDKGNTPCQLNSIKMPGEGLSLKLTAVEMWCLFCYFPIGHLVPKDDIHWVFFCNCRSTLILRCSLQAENFTSVCIQLMGVLFEAFQTTFPLSSNQA